jgi:hypothetical protein
LNTFPLQGHPLKFLYLVKSVKPKVYQKPYLMHSFSSSGCRIKYVASSCILTTNSCQCSPRPYYYAPRTEDIRANNFRLVCGKNLAHILYTTGGKTFILGICTVNQLLLFMCEKFGKVCEIIIFANMSHREPDIACGLIDTFHMPF